MTALIQQRTAHDCAICCMAMVTGRPYEDVLGAVGDAFDPDKGMRYEQEALKRLGFDYRFERGEPVGDISCLHRGFEISPEFFRRLAWARRALMSVPSFNFADTWHMVYWDGSKVFDPSPLKTYRDFRELKPEAMVLFREVGT